jgi:hypothetical protein
LAIDLLTQRHADGCVERVFRKAIELDEKDAGLWIGLGDLLRSP